MWGSLHPPALMGTSRVGTVGRSPDFIAIPAEPRVVLLDPQAQQERPKVLAVFRGHDIAVVDGRDVVRDERGLRFEREEAD